MQLTLDAIEETTRPMPVQPEFMVANYIFGEYGVTKLAPRLVNADTECLPTTLQETYDWMRKRLPKSFCTLDEASEGEPEGLVIRTPDRAFIAKMRFEDYRKALRISAKR